VHYVFNIADRLEKETLTSDQVVGLCRLGWLEQVAVVVIDALQLYVIQVGHRRHQVERQPFKVKLLDESSLTELGCLKVF
jgi:hypothetical protein